MTSTSAQTETMLRRIVLSDEQRAACQEFVLDVHSHCPGQTEFRYLNYIRGLPDLPLTADDIEPDRADVMNDDRPILLTNLPHFDDIERSKIVALTIGEAIGTCVAYMDYNQSYITDIRPTDLSREKSSGVDLLPMHNDLAWASDRVRPRALVLVAHIARGGVPKTLLAPVSCVLDRLEDETIEILQRNWYESRSGSSLAWGGEEVVRRTSLLEMSEPLPVLRLNFDTFAPAQSLSADDRARAEHALGELHQAAADIGPLAGHAIQKGEALVIGNDHCAHGRAPIDQEQCERMLLRAYVVPDAVRRIHTSSMLSLRD